MYIEQHGAGWRVESARIGRVTFSKTGKTIYYGGRELRRIGRGEYADVETGDHYFISGPRKDGLDRGGPRPLSIEIDEDVRREYWAEVRGQPARASERITRG